MRKISNEQTLRLCREVLTRREAHSLPKKNTRGQSHHQEQARQRQKSKAHSLKLHSQRKKARRDKEIPGELLILNF
jgi:hypothetical protein